MRRAERLVGKRLLEWQKFLRDYMVWQLAIQGAGVLAGLLFVNLMSIREYAFYTLASSALTLLAVLCDLGITNSLPYFRRETSIRKLSFAAYVRAATWLRRVLLVVGTPVFLGIFGSLALRNGFGPEQTSVSALIVIVGVWFQARAAINVTALRLVARYPESYRAEFLGALARLIGSGIMAVSSLSYALLALMINAVASVLTSVASQMASVDGERDQRDRRSAAREIVRYIVPTLPSAVHFALQGPLIAFLSATFGGTRNIAEVGALSRLGLMVGFLTGFIPAVIIPRMSAVLNDDLYRRRYTQYGAVLGLCGLILLLVAYEWPWLFLALLGSGYRGLHEELVLSVGAASVGLLGAYCSLINQARGWVRWQAAGVLVYALTQVIFIGILPLSTTAGVLFFNLISAVAGGLVQFVINAVGFARPGWVGLGRPA
jgi:O-antigen/teichoic acid export membrane protein